MYRRPGSSPVAVACRYAAYVLNTALGGGTSSRLFQEVRESGRVYSIYSFISSFIDSGYFGVYRRESGMG